MLSILLIKKVTPKTIYLNDFIKWISSEKFIKLSQKNVFFFWMIYEKRNVYKQFKFRIVNCFSIVTVIDFIRKKKILVYLNIQGNLNLKSLSCKNLFLNFFFGYKIVSFTLDFYKKEIIYIIGEGEKNLFFHKSRPVFHFMIFNTEEGKLIKIFNIQNVELNKKLFQFNEKLKTIIIAFENNLNFFIVNWTYKKIKKIKIKHSSDIFCLECNSNYLIIADNAGYIFLFQNNTQRKENAEKKAFSINYEFFFFLKKKIIFNRSTFQILNFRKNKTILFNFLEKLKFILFDINFKKKKLVFFFNSKNKNSIAYVSPFSNSQLLIRRSDDVLFLVKEKKRFKILQSDQSQSVDLMVNIHSFSSKQHFNVSLFPIFFSGNFFFVIFGISNLYQILDFKKNKLFKKIYKIHKMFLNNTTKINLGFFRATQNFTAKTLVVGYYSMLLKIIINSNCFEKIKIFFLMIQKNKIIQNKKIFIEENFGSNGKKVAMFFSDGKLKIWNVSSFLSRNSERFTRMSGKKINCMCFSSNSLFLATSFLRTLIIWKFSFGFQPVSFSTLEFESDICFLKFFSFDKKSFFLVGSKKEIAIWDLIQQSVAFIVKIKVLKIHVDPWSDKYMLVTKFFKTKLNQTNQCIVIFKKDLPVPLTIIDLVFLSKTKLISSCFSYFRKKHTSKSILVIDTLLNIYKIFY